MAKKNTAESALEVWKDIQGFDGYQVSSLGRVKSLNYRQTGKEGVLSPGLNTHMYHHVVLRKNNRNHIRTVHRLVCETFLPHSVERNFVNHKDGNKTNNSLENLEWCTASENTQHAMAELGMRPGNRTNIKRGKNHPNAVGVVQLLNGVEINRFGCMMDAARATGANFRHIWDVCKGKYKTTSGFEWRYT